MDLKALKTFDTDKRVFKAIHKGEDIYGDESFGIIPDLVLIPEDGFALSSKIESGKVFVPPSTLCGTHTLDDAFVWSSSPEISKASDICQVGRNIFSFFELDTPWQ